MNSKMFNLSEEMLQQVEIAAKAIENNSVVDSAYGCVCCGSGWCAVGIASD